MNITTLKYNYTVILGDFNYPCIDWNEWTTLHNELHSEFQFIECLRDNYLSQEILKPTRYRLGQTANILDLLLVDKSEIVDKIKFNSGLGASHHLSYSAYLVCNPEINDSDTVKYNFHKGDYMAISEDL